jgi:UDP-2,3-diacylglucosamine pyrophosphatase LpxH
MQIPYQSTKIFHSFLEFCNDFYPDRVVIIGDFLDVPGPARWNRGTALEFAGTLQRECLSGQNYLAALRGVVGDRTQIDFHSGNHEKRVESYIRNKAPAFSGLEALRIPNLLGFDKLGISLLPDVAPFATGWVTTHGDVASRTLSKSAGSSALIQAKRIGKSVVMGHTHRLGVVSETIAGKVLTGVETGHMMDTRKASYISYPNWQAGWAAFELENNRVTHIRPVHVTASGGILYV